MHLEAFGRILGFLVHLEAFGRIWVLSGALGGFLSLIAGKGHSVLVIFTGTFL